VSKTYHVLPPTAPVPAPDDVLERLVREGARKMLQDALEAEVDDFLGRRRYQRTEEQRGYRNGHLPERTIKITFSAEFRVNGGAWVALDPVTQSYTGSQVVRAVVPMVVADSIDK
jgi:hypothetical protein